MKRDIHACNHHVSYYINPEGNGLIDRKLPYEFIQRIFMSLRSVDFLSTCSVNHFWMERTLYIAKSNRDEMTQSVILLNKKINSQNKDHVLSLYELNASIPYLNSGICDLKKFIGLKSLIKQNFFNVLMHLPIEELTRIRQDFPLFDPIFDLAHTYKEIETDTVKNTSMKLVNALDEIDDAIPFKIDRLSVMPEPPHAIEISKSQILSTLSTIILKVPSQEKDTFIKDVSVFLAHKGLIDDALTLADKIEDDSTRNFTFMLIISSTQDVYQTMKNK